MYNNYDQEAGGQRLWQSPGETGVLSSLIPQEVLDKCAWCGRTFTPAALKIHAKSCTEDPESNTSMCKHVSN